MVSIKTYCLLTSDLPLVSDLSPLSHPESRPTVPQKLLSCADTSWHFCFIINALLLSRPFILCPVFLDAVCSANTEILHSCFLCPHCCPPRYLILCYHLSCFSFLPHSTSVDQLSQSPPSVSFLCSWNRPCVLSGLILSYGCIDTYHIVCPENQPLSLTPSVQMAVHSLCSLFVHHDLQPEEKKTTSSLPYLSVAPSGLLAR